MDQFLRVQNASVHRAAYKLANSSTNVFESSRDALAGLINAPASDEIVFTSGATESLNMIAQGLTAKMLSGTKCLVCASEHHANLLPWQRLAEQFDLEIQILALEDGGHFNDSTLDKWLSVLDQDVALVACAHVSNVLGNIYPVQALCDKARSVGALSVIDGTQALAHLPVDVQYIGCDFYVFSGHKMYGPTGVGVLWGKYEHLSAMQAYKLGGEMVTHVSYQSFTTSPPPMKFEAGTPNFSAVIGLKAAVVYLQDRRTDISSYENLLYKRLLKGLSALEGLTLYGNHEQSIAIVSFRFTDIDNHSAVLQLYEQGFALRYGQHCAMPLLTTLGIDACLRVSLGCYNTIEEVDLFVLAVSKLLATEGMFALNDEQGASEHTDSAYMQAANEHESLSFETMLKNASSWPEKHRQLLLLSKQLPLLSASERSTDNRVSGCEANVWLDYDLQQKKVLGYSDSKVVRGLMAILLLKHAVITVAPTHNHHAGLAVEHDFDYLQYLTELGLSTYFSEGRKDGVKAMVKRIKSFR